jgi:membrane peptidoglycan carboxypeptidase
MNGRGSNRNDEGRLRRARNWLAAHPVAVAGVVAGILGLVTLGLGLGLGAWQAVCRDCPSVAQIYVWEPKQSTRILDREGRLIAELFEERRTPIDISTLPPHVGQAFVSVEDKRFYSHGDRLPTAGHGQRSATSSAAASRAAAAPSRSSSRATCSRRASASIRWSRAS